MLGGKKGNQQPQVISNTVSIFAFGKNCVRDSSYCFSGCGSVLSFFSFLEEVG